MNGTEQNEMKVMAETQNGNIITNVVSVMNTCDQILENRPRFHT